MKFVATKTAEQLDLQALHRVRERLVSQRTGIINQISRLHAGTRDRRAPGNRLPAHGAALTILATRTDAPCRHACLRVIEELAGDWRRLDQRDRWPNRRDRGTGPSRLGMFAPDDGAWHRTDHFERHGGRDRHWRRILQRPRLRRLARTGAQASLDGRPHDPRQNLQERRQSLPARSVRAGGMGCAGQDKELGTLRATNPGSKPPRGGCTPTCWRSRSPTSLPASRWAVLATRTRLLRADEVTDDAGVRPAVDRSARSRTK